jgi:hypothetical protein
VRNFVIFAWISLMSQLSFAQARIWFESVVHDFGVAKEGQYKFTYPFTYKNTGDSILVISDVVYSCDCSATNWDIPLRPGEVGHIDITLYSKKNESAFLEDFEVISNSRIASVTLSVEGKTPYKASSYASLKKKMGAFRIASQHVTFGNLEHNSVRSLVVPLYNASDFTILIDSTSIEAPKHLSISFDSFEIEPHSSSNMTIQLDAKELKRIGYGEDNLRFYTNEIGDASLKEFFIVSTILPKLENTSDYPQLIIDSQDIDLGIIKAGEIASTQIRFTNVGSAPLRIFEIKPNCECLHFSNVPKTIGIGQSAYFEIYFDTRNRLDNQYKSISVFTNDPDMSAVLIKLKANVVR